MSKTLEIKLVRTIAASPSEVYSAWLNPKTPGTPWYEHSKLIFNPKVDGLFYWLFGNGTPHFGRFTKLQRGKMIQHTWMSPYTNGIESKITVSFKKTKEGTTMTLLHSGLPKTEEAKAHKDGWTYFMDKLTKEFAKKKRRK